MGARHAVSAQSVAARTYAAFERAHPAAGHYDLCDTTQCQVYGGVDVEHPAATDAIEATAQAGPATTTADPAFTQFSASNGGFSSAGSMPYLRRAGRPVRRPRATRATRPGPRRSTTPRSRGTGPPSATWLSIEVTARDGNGDWGGRVTDMAFIGTTGTARVDGDTVRSYFGLNSDWFTFAVTPAAEGPGPPVTAAPTAGGCCSPPSRSPPRAARRAGRRTPTARCPT